MAISNSETQEFLIIGQGIAGSSLAVELLKREISFHILDNGHKSSASSIAAGLVNPITGRRYVKSWMIDTLVSVALDKYNACQEEYGVTIIKELPINRSLKSASNENEWLNRMTWAGWDTYMAWSENNSIKGLNVQCQSIGIIKEAFVVNIPLYLKTVKEKCSKDGMLIQCEFNYDDLSYADGFWRLDGYTYKNVVFCEGAKVVDNKYFNFLPFSPAKGECMLIKSDILSADIISISDVTIIPQINQTFWVGSTYEWDFVDGRPSQLKYENLISRLDSIIDHPYEVLSYSAAIRPSSDDRRPMLGRHPQFGGLYIFNGLGTKGASLAPYFANHLMEHICDQSSLISEVNIRRWQRLNKS